MITKHLLSVLATAFLLALIIAGGLAYYGNASLQQARSFDDAIFTIKKGQSLQRFAADLQTKGVINEPYSLSLYARYKNLGGKLHTGQFHFTDGMTLLDILDAVTTGKNKLTRQFTFIQGSTFAQLLASLAKADDIEHTFGKQSPAQILRLIDIEKKYSHPEGLFFPETYAYHPGETDQIILARAFKFMQRTLEELWEKRADNLKISTPYEALILASIIEKETAQASERSHISGVFMNRLNKGMRLQTDPTVIYGIGDAYTGNITRKHLKTDTPYNTYTRYGLPPTPICMPGRAAIEAALNPKKTDAIYFVAKGDGSGEHQFSKTLDAHNRAVKQYLKHLRKAG